MGSDVRQTKLHHNAVFIDSMPAEKLHSLIYHDNWMNTMETCYNMTFLTDNNIDYYYDVYVQRADLFPSSYAVINIHDNIHYGYVTGGLSAIAAEDYPGGIYFHTGVRY